MNLKKIIQLDAEFSAKIRISSTTGPLWKVATFLAHSGDSWFWLAGLGVVWLSSWLINDEVWRYRTVVLAAAIVIQACFVLAIKFLIRRQRPEGEWGSIYRNTDPHSFPSGHATRAALLAAMCWILGPLWLGIGLTVWVPLVSLARVSTGVHYLSDVLAGIVLGILITAALMAINLPDILMMFFPFVF